MPLILGKDGVNRVLKDVYLGGGGLNKQQKELYLGKDGVSKHIYAKPLLYINDVPFDNEYKVFSPAIKAKTIEVTTKVINGKTHCMFYILPDDPFDYNNQFGFVHFYDSDGDNYAQGYVMINNNKYIYHRAPFIGTYSYKLVSDGVSLIIYVNGVQKYNNPYFGELNINGYQTQAYDKSKSSITNFIIT